MWMRVTHHPDLHFSRVAIQGLEMLSRPSTADDSGISVACRGSDEIGTDHAIVFAAMPVVQDTRPVLQAVVNKVEVSHLIQESLSLSRSHKLKKTQVIRG
jgi:hypothetical protein